MHAYAHTHARMHTHRHTHACIRSASRWQCIHDQSFCHGGILTSSVLIQDEGTATRMPHAVLDHVHSCKRIRTPPPPSTSTSSAATTAVPAAAGAPPPPPAPSQMHVQQHTQQQPGLATDEALGGWALAGPAGEGAGMAGGGVGGHAAPPQPAPPPLASQDGLAQHYAAAGLHTVPAAAAPPPVGPDHLAAQQLAANNGGSAAAAAAAAAAPGGASAPSPSTDPTTLERQAGDRTFVELLSWAWSAYERLGTLVTGHPIDINEAGNHVGGSSLIMSDMAMLAGDVCDLGRLLLRLLLHPHKLRAQNHHLGNGAQPGFGAQNAALAAVQVEGQGPPDPAHFPHALQMLLLRMLHPSSSKRATIHQVHRHRA